MAPQKVSNRILVALPANVRAEILRHLHHVEFPAGQMIFSEGMPLEYAYFIDSGMVSLLKNMQDGRRVEIGEVGIEGLAGLFAAHGLETAVVDYVVQVPVTALRINRWALRHEMINHEALRGLIEKYLILLFDKVAQAAACNRLHSLEARLCRWLLVAHDNASADQFTFTHESLASLLGVQRPSLSTAANQLQKRGLIRYSHGRITILDRAALEKASCECYRVIRRQIDALFD